MDNSINKIKVDERMAAFVENLCNLSSAEILKKVSGTIENPEQFYCVLDKMLKLNLNPTILSMNLDYVAYLFKTRKDSELMSLYTVKDLAHMYYIVCGEDALMGWSQKHLIRLIRELLEYY